jgi:hypothetical protein
MYRCCKLENCALLGYYAASNGNFLPTFRDNLSVPSSGFKNPKDSLLSQYGVCGCSPVSHYHNCYNSFYYGTSLSKAALTTTLPSLSNTCINATGWHHATETFHRPRFSPYKPRIGTAGFLLDSWTLKVGPIGCPEMSVGNYHCSLRNNLEERSFRLLRGGSLKLRML